MTTIPREERGVNKNTVLILSGILLVTYFVYSNVYKFDFVRWDDDAYIIYNPLIQDFSLHGIKTIFISIDVSNYHPFTTLLNAIELKLLGLHPSHFHLINILLHLLNVVMVFIFIRMLLKPYRFSKPVRSFDFPALLCAFFFGVHPMHVESVTWVSERKDLLYTLFFLSSMIFYLYFLQGKRSVYFYFLALFAFFCSLLSKSAAVTLPLILLLLDYWLDRKWSRVIGRNLLIEKIPFFLLSLVFGILALVSQGTTGAMDLTRAFQFYDRPFLACYGIVFYLIKFFVPTGLSAIYPYPVKEGLLLPFEYYVAFLVLGLLVYAIIRCGPYQKTIIFGSLFFLVGLSLVLQIIPVGKAIVADRYTYLPYLGLFFIIGQIPPLLKEHHYAFLIKVKHWMIAVLLCYALILPYAAFSRNSIWRNDILFFSDIIEKYKTVEVAYNNRAGAYEREKNYKSALADYSEAIRVNAAYSDPYNNRANVKHILKDYAGAMADLTEAIRIKPTFADAYFNRGNLKLDMQNMEGAWLDYTRAIEIKSDYVRAYINRGVIRERQKDYPGAIEQYNHVLRINPKSGDSYFNRGNAYYYLNKLSDACQDWNRALELGQKEASGNINNFCLNNR